MNKIYILIKNEYNTCAEGQDYPYHNIIAACGEEDKDKLYTRLTELNKFAEKAIECVKEIAEWNVSHLPCSYKEEIEIKKSIYNKYGFHNINSIDDIISTMYEIIEIDNDYNGYDRRAY